MAGGMSIGKGATSHLACVCLYVPWRESVCGVCMVRVCGGEWRQVSGACSWLSEWGHVCVVPWVPFHGRMGGACRQWVFGSIWVFAMCQRVYGVGGW